LGAASRATGGAVVMFLAIFIASAVRAILHG
jgi:hypothetical protein